VGWDTPSSALHYSLTQVSNNITDPMSAAAEHLVQPDTARSGVNFQPTFGHCESDPLDLDPFAAQTAYDVGFNDAPKADKRHRRAYAGLCTKPAWSPQPAIKPQP
jgi:hypothetical protein